MNLSTLMIPNQRLPVPALANLSGSHTQQETSYILHLIVFKAYEIIHLLFILFI